MGWTVPRNFGVRPRASRSRRDAPYPLPPWCEYGAICAIPVRTTPPPPTVCPRWRFSLVIWISVDIQREERMTTNSKRKTQARRTPRGNRKRRESIHVVWSSVLLGFFFHLWVSLALNAVFLVLCPNPNLVCLSLIPRNHVQFREV